jgi:hypothetical protein
MMERRRQVAGLRTAGIRDERAIARQLGISRQTVNRDIHWLMEQYRQAALIDVAAEKGQDLLRIEAALASLWPRVMSGTVSAHVAALGWMERRAKLLGLDAPKVLRIDVEAEIRMIAEREGLDPEEAVVFAQRYFQPGLVSGQR